MIKRPNSKETEEDLLLQQKEFLRRRSASHASTTMAGLINLQERLKKLERSGRKMSEKICGSVMSPVVERNYNDVTVKDEVPVELSTCRVNEEKMWNQGSFSGSSKEAKEMKFDGHSTVGASDQQRPANDRHTMFMDILRMKDKLRLNPSHSSKSCDTTKQTPNVAPKTEHENSMAANRFLNDTSISEIKKDFSISRIRQTSTMVYPYQSASEDITSSNVTAFKDNYEFRTRIPSESLFQNSCRVVDELESSVGQQTIGPQEFKGPTSQSSFAVPSSRRKTMFAKRAQCRFSLAAKPMDIEAIKREVDKENAAMLSKMSKDEIADLRKRVLGNAGVSSSEIAKLVSSRCKLVGCEEVRKIEEEERAREDFELPFKVASSWLNMDVVEKEKLKWTTDTSPTESNEPPAWRFDLEGNLLPLDANVPTERGLHHHGDEPQRPGYSVKELLYLTRSAVLNQRVLAVSTLAKILKKAPLGINHVVSMALFNELMNGNAVVLIRLCFDDRAGAMLSACLRFFEALLFNPSEEELLDFTLECFGGFTQPWLIPSASAELREGNKSLSNDEIVKVDVIEALMRMQFLQRLESVFRDGLVKLSSPAVGDQTGSTLGAAVVNILCRMARHSMDACDQIMACELIFRNWLLGCLSDSSFSDEQNAIIPRAKVVRLIRILSCADKQIADQLVEGTSIRSMILQTITTEPSNLRVNECSACELIVECYRCWRCLISYGLLLSDVRDVQNVLVDQIRQACDIAKGNVNLCQPHFALIRLRLIAATLESYLIASRDSDRVDAISVANSCSYYLEIPLLEITYKCADYDLTGLHASYSVLLAALFNYFATSAHFGVQSLSRRDSCLQVAMKRFGNSLLPTVGNLTKWSTFLQANDRPALSTSDWLSPPLGVHCLVDGEGKFSPFPLCASWVRLLNYSKLPCCRELSSNIISSKSVEAYLGAMSVAGKPAERSNFFARFELYFLYFLMPLGDRESVDIWKVAVQRPRYLTGGQEFLYCECLRSLISDKCLLWPCISGEQRPVESWNADFVASMDALMPALELYRVAFTSLPEIRSVIIDDYSKERRPVVQRSKAQLHACGLFSEDVQLLSANVSGWTSRLQSGHCFLIPMHRHVREIAKVAGIPPEDSEGLRLVICSLLLSFLAMGTRFLIDPAELYCYLCELFYTGYFKEPLVYQCLGVYLRDCFSKLKKIAFRVPWQGETFMTFYCNLVDHFNSHSYGDHLFAHYLLLPVAKGSDSEAIAALFNSEKPNDSFIASLQCDLNSDLIGHVETSKEARLVDALAKMLQSGIPKGSLLYQLAVKRLGI